ncbi:MAG TPA: Re/Si-specific NAD(P)(+) transhydrogenase subunit alpha [Bacteroidia bacterium]|nr:Re/Si-specific NAD(P)(+) transhydrogenase subunit alpha [Bacteroidota bacterium]MBP9790846.1 Re/Si-specific NAD(P)(+) transhydrogenase subunit alpha [Bacteroidia bacterium]MBK7429971.1 Re/Si-specific NAD(P)(+) transhydrogenase subunit alpha [Bacteroidota bacterium]MBK7573032.1 Re/Si-specific NAD(P)(+) transhydrogenase subunit alpha [Bacteroidota bacterium]MBP9923696.1 Re/Si-specific NAD(P)(+) transhydrogenase subunit alpha [Bacteroidia bacterium]
MKVNVPKEKNDFERRVAITPEVAQSLIKAGFEVNIEKDAGLNSYFDNAAYEKAGAKIVDDPNAIYRDADVILKVNAPTPAEIGQMKKDSILISMMYASTNQAIVEACQSAGISAFSMDAIPRISRAQKMDVLSSQANLAGYKAVMIGAAALGKIFPLLMTAAGTIKPSKVVIMGAGVAGLQAIATAKRLGAIVEVSDIRPETKEQVESLGGKFIEVKGDASVKLEGGYVKGVSDEFLKNQQVLIAKHISEADLVITTALIPGRKAPVLVTDDMVKSMKMGSVIVDMAVAQGGNCTMSEVNKTVVKNGVTIIGESNLPSLLPLNASELYAKNIQAFLLHLATHEGFKWEMEEEITKGSLIVHKGQAVHPSLNFAVNA